MLKLIDNLSELDEHLKGFERTATGFPSPADDFREVGIDLNKELVENPFTTFFAVADFEFKDAGILRRALMIIDRSLKPKSNDVVVCVLDGEFLSRRVVFKGTTGCLLLPVDGEDVAAVEITAGQDFLVWGVVTWTLNRLLKDGKHY